MTTRRGVAIGCGGILGFAWTAVALDAIERALGWDLRTAEVLVGTSAGAELVAALGSGRTPADLLSALDGAPGADLVLARHVSVDPGKIPPLPGLGFPGLGLIGAGVRGGSAYTALAGFLPRGRGDASWLREYGSALAPNGWVDHPNTWLVAADAATGKRVAFGANPPFHAGATADDIGANAATVSGGAVVESPVAATDIPVVDLGEAIAASWAIPGWFPPVRIGGHSYVDGGAVSSVSADLLVPLGLDEVVIVAPMTSEGGAPATGLNRVERLLRAQMTRGLDREVALLRAAGTRVIRVEPGPEDLAAMGPNFMDFARRASTLATARRTAPRRVAAAIRVSNQGVNR
ncbi:patatin-like phospholipase family protein [Nocardia mangyaensis]|uniref:patatin-like phospholipase family protein n=1 Tax=Nocardia mangyaensis TaxID=2213200 RepID=UPI0026748B9D|nr:patatin-like phospholipase family protein [Nocardia mangyaensis]MDO3649683.1 patatin-like phospholipase family protein [Nocardia mangyaensis]